MEKNEVLNKLYRIFTDILAEKANGINEDSDLMYDLGCDSLTKLMIYNQIEVEFDITFELKDFDKIKKVSDIYNILNNKM